MSGVEKCHYCKRSRMTIDMARMNDWPYCHGAYDDSPTCYQLRQWKADGLLDSDIARRIIDIRESNAAPAAPTN